MEYQVIARKYRPQTFSSIVGQQHVAKTLINSIESNRIGHAFLFTGPRGVGKTTTARILAKTLQCVNGPTPEPCNNCGPCKEITAGNCIDVFEIDGASNRGIDEIRDLKEKIQYNPIRDRYKIYIIDEVHMLTKEAFNALLKTLEEPPPHAKFIFATTEIHKIPATIQSRCQRFDFRLLPPKDIIESLKTICDGENINISTRALNIISQSAAGSLRDAQSLLEKIVSFSGSKVKEEDVLPLLGLANPELLKTLVQGILDKNPEVCFTSFEKIYNTGADLIQFYAQLRDQFRVLLIMKTMKSPNVILDDSESDIDGWKPMIEKVSGEELYAYLRILVDAEGDVRSSLNPRLLLEMLFFKMIRVDRLKKISDLLKQVQELKENILSQPGSTHESGYTGSVPGKKQEPLGFDTISMKDNPGDNISMEQVAGKQSSGEETEEDSSSTENNPGKLLVKAVRKKNLVLSSYLELAKIIGPEDGVVKSVFTETNSFTHDKVKEKNNLDLIKKTCQQLFGQDTEFVVVMEEKKTNPSNPARTQVDELRKKALENPLVKKTLDLFEGEITNIE